jgi:hypothetical protein
MPRPRRALASLLVLALLAPAARARADASTEAASHASRGLELRRAGDDAGALAEFMRAYELAPSPRLRAQVGLALQALGRWLDADAALTDALRAKDDAWVIEHRALLEESLASVQQHLAWLTVECNVAGAKLDINGVAIGTLPLAAPVGVVAGAIVLDVRAEGYEPIRRTIDVSAASRARETFALVKRPDRSPPRAAPSVAKPGEGAAERALGWAALGAGGALIAGGAAAYYVRAHYASIYTDDSQCFVAPLNRDERCGWERGTSDTALTVSIILFAAGGLTAATGAYLLLTAPPAQPQTTTAIRCAPALGGVTCATRF